jgi:putative transposase
MPNHWHLVLRPRRGQDLSDFMRWLTVTHTQRWRAHTHTEGEGHLYQGRYKSFPVQTDAHFLAVCRYVERNAQAAKLVERAQDWRWSSLWERVHGRAGEAGIEAPWPVERPRDWLAVVNRPLRAWDAQEIQRSIRRGRPYGEVEWQQRIGVKLGLEHTFRERGRPRKVEKE